MDNIGIDTISVHKRFNDLGEVNEIISLCEPGDQANTFWLDEKLKFSLIPHNPLSLSLLLTIPSFVSDNKSNILPARPPQIKQCIKKLLECTGIDWSDALLSRVDVNLTFPSVEPPHSYLQLLQPYSNYEIKDYEDGRYLLGRELTLVCYDKYPNQKLQGLPSRKSLKEEEESKDSRLTRFELKMLRHIARHLSVPREVGPADLQFLSEAAGFHSAVHYFTKTIMRMLRLKSYLESVETEFCSPHGFHVWHSKSNIQSNPDSVKKIVEKMRKQQSISVKTYQSLLEEIEAAQLSPLATEVYEILQGAINDLNRFYPLITPLK